MLIDRGGVMIDTAVAFGSAKEATSGTVSYVASSEDGGGAKDAVCIGGGLPAVGTAAVPWLRAAEGGGPGGGAAAAVRATGACADGGCAEGGASEAVGGASLAEGGAAEGAEAEAWAVGGARSMADGGAAAASVPARRESEL